VIETLRAFVYEKFIDHESQMKCKTDVLVQIFELGIERAEHAVIKDLDYLKIFGVQESISAGALWKHIFDSLIHRGNTVLDKWKPELSIVLNEGSLSSRILKAVGKQQSPADIREVYRKLSDCLEQNKLFLP
jgi:carboxylate-amine ligase